MEHLIYVLPVFGIIALVYMFFLSQWVVKQDAGDAKMQGIANHIAEGAMAFLKAEDPYPYYLCNHCRYWFGLLIAGR